MVVERLTITVACRSPAFYGMKALKACGYEPKKDEIRLRSSGLGGGNELARRGSRICEHVLADAA